MKTAKELSENNSGLVLSIVAMGPVVITVRDTWFDSPWAYVVHRPHSTSERGLPEVPPLLFLVHLLGCRWSVFITVDLQSGISMRSDP
jgi:hypothetical protein